jgi:DnaK suppressor protein
VEPSDTEALVEALDAELEGVEGALRRLDDGRYGTCVHCGRPLPSPAVEDDPLLDRCPSSCRD